MSPPAGRLRPGVRQLERLASELGEAIVGGVVQETRVGGPELLALAVRVPGATVRLGLSVLPEAAGPLLLSARPRRDPDWEAGTNFWQLVRAALPASSVERVRVPPGERTLLLELRRGAERSILAAAFHGARPNLVLLRDGVVLSDLRGRAPRGAGLDDLLRQAPGPPRADAEPVLALEEWTRRLSVRRGASLAGARLHRLEAALAKARGAARTRARRRREDAERLGDADGLRRQAEALSAHLHELTRGDLELSLPGWPDPEADEPVTVPLDATREPSANLQRLWQRVRKADRGREEARSRAAEAEARAEAIEGLESRLEAIREAAGAGREEALSELDAVEEAALPHLPKPKVAGPKRGSESPSLPFRRFTSFDGLPILVGRSSKANDELSFRVASGNDLWLHAAGVAGSHVVVKLPRGAEVPQETLLDAATLAHVHSKRKSDSHGEVTWCRAKHLSKRKGMPAGQVLVSQEKSLRVRVEPERLERLKATEE